MFFTESVIGRLASFTIGAILLVGTVAVTGCTGGEPAEPDGSMADSGDMGLDAAPDGDSGRDIGPDTSDGGEDTSDGSSQDPPERMTNLTAPNAGDWGVVRGFGQQMSLISQGSTAFYAERGGGDRLVLTDDCGVTSTVVPPSDLGSMNSPQQAASTSSRQLVRGGSGSLWLSENFGSSWTDVSNSAPGVVLAIEATSDAFLALVGDPNEMQKAIYRSTDGQSWSKWSPDFSFFGQASLQVSGQAVWLREGVDQVLHYTSDGGTTWNKVSGFAGPSFPWVRLDGDLYGLSDSGELLTSTQGETWSAVENESIPTQNLAIASASAELHLVSESESLVSLSSAQGNLSKSRTISLGPVPGRKRMISLVGCSSGDVSLSTPQGLLRVADDDSIANWGPDPRSGFGEVIANSNVVFATPYLRRNFTGFAERNVPTSFEGSSFLRGVAVGDTLYVGAETAPDTSVQLYELTGSGSWEPAVSNIQENECGEDIDECRPSGLYHFPESAVSWNDGLVVGYPGIVETEPDTTISGGGITYTPAGGDSQPFASGLTRRRCRGSESIDRGKARLCPAGIKDLAVNRALWAATGDPHTDTFEVHRRKMGGASWVSMHDGLPEEIQDLTPLDEDLGDRGTEADFAVADGHIFIRTRRFPSNEFTIHWFDDETSKWWPVPTEGLQGRTVRELLGDGSTLLAGTDSGLMAWSDNQGSWVSVGSGFPGDTSANDYHMTPDGRVFVATAGRGIRSVELNQ